MGRTNIYMPSLGEGIIEATVIKLLKNEGEYIEEDEPVIEIATDKVDTEIVASESGIVEEIRVKPNDIVKVGEVVVILKTESVSDEYRPSTEETETSLKGPEGEESFVLKKSSTTAKPSEEKTATKESRKEQELPDKEPTEIQKESSRNLGMEESPMQEAVGHAESPQKVFLSPLVKKIIKEEGLGYDEVISLKGSGYMGRITRDDLLKYIKYKKEGALHGAEVKEISSKSTISYEEDIIDKKTSRTDYKETAEPSTNGERNYTEKEMDRVRMLIAQHTVESKKIAPHVTSFIEVDISCFTQIRKEYKGKYMSEYGLKLTFTPLFIAATAMALARFPEINSSISGNKIRYYNNINIGIATALANGNLIVPVIKGTESLNLRGIVGKLKELTEKAKTNSLDPTDITGGTFTISNFGSFTTMAGTPIIVQPQSAILGIGEIKKRAIVIESESGDSIAIRPTAIISLSFDHRIIDGALAGKFLGYLRECIEDFSI